jgi:uncharacterized protein YndB with AHSA1/START domain
MAPDSIVKEVRLHVARDRVWRALTDHREFGSWYGAKFEGPFAPGSMLKGRIVPTTADAAIAKMQKEREGAPFVITVERMDPERLFSFRWHPAPAPDVDYSHEPTTLVEFRLADEGRDTLLTVTESGFDGIPLKRRAEAFSMDELGWECQVMLIEKYLAPRSR